MFKSFKSLLGLSLLAFFGVWMGCSSDSSPVSPSNKAVTDDDGSATQVSTFTVSTEVSIPDDSLRVAVTQELWHLSAAGKLDIPTGSNPLTTANLAKIKVLDASGKGITNLEGLQHATNLDTLYLANNTWIRDVTPLAGLTGLKWLDLSRNKIADVTPLAGLDDLEALFLYRNGFWGDAALPLASLTKLKRFSMGSGEFRAQVAPLVTKMPDLEWLKVNGTNIGNLDFLKELPKLEWLDISGNGITDFKPLACLEKLKTLHLRNMNSLAWSTTADGLLLSSDDHIQYLLNIGVTIGSR